MASQPPVDTLNFAELIQRFTALVEAQNASRNMVPVAERVGAGPFTFSADNEGGKVIRINNGSTGGVIVATLPKNAPVGTVLMPRQTGPAQVKFVAENGASIVPYQPNHNATAGLNAKVILTCEKNVGGNAAVWHLDGISGIAL
jgi:hypothetical protein